MSKKKIPLRKSDSPTGHGGRVVAMASKRIRISEPKGIAKIVEAMWKDPIVVLVRRVVFSTMQTSEISVEVEGGDDRAQLLADNLKQQFEKALPREFECFDFGRVANEFYPETTDDGRTHLLGGIDSLAFKSTEMVLDDCGQFAGVKFKAKGEPHVIPNEWSWWCALDPTAEEPHGRSRHLGAPLEVWKKRQKLWRNKDNWLSRFANGWGFGKAPTTYPEEVLSAMGPTGQTYPDGQPVNPQRDFQEAIGQLASGGVVIAASGTHPPERGGGDLYTFEPPTTRQDATPLENEEQSLDDDMLRAYGVPERSVTQNSDVGSNAMAATHADPLLSLCEDLLGQITASYQEQVVERFVDLNYASNRPKLTIKFESLRNPSKVVAIQLLTAIFASPEPSRLIVNGVLDLEKLMEIAGVPAGTDVPEKLKAVLTQMAMQAAMSMPPQTPSEPTAAPAPAAEQPTELEAETGGEKVSDTALNGAQITSMVDIMGQLATKAISPDTAGILLRLAFPTIDDAEIAKLVKSAAKYSQPVAVAAARRRAARSEAAPTVPDWEAISKQADADAAKVMEEIRASLSDQQSIDRRRLRRRSLGVPPPDRKAADGVKARGRHAAVPKKPRRKQTA